MSYINASLDFATNEVMVWERAERGSPRTLVRYPAPYYAYFETNADNVGLPEPVVDNTTGFYNTLTGLIARRFDFENRNELKASVEYATNRGQLVFESDIPPELKVLSDNYHDLPIPPIHVQYLDIEVDYNPEIGFSSTDNPYAPINAIAFYSDWNQKTNVIAVPPKTWGRNPKVWQQKLDKSLLELADIEFFATEKELLWRMFEIIDDADALCGWNSEFFDFPYITKRVEIVFGKSGLRRLEFEGAALPKFTEVEVFGKKNVAVSFSGRVLLDYLQIFKKFEMAGRPSYSLDAISSEILPNLTKLEYDGTLASLYTDDFNHFLRYNIRDTECLKGFEAELGYVALASEMVHNSTGRFRDVLGTVRLADMSMINYCHYVMGVVVPNSPAVEHSDGDVKAEGAYVLDPKAGEHNWIGSVDIGSLYPNVIRSCNVSPEKIVGQFITDVHSFEEIVKNTRTQLTLVLEDGGESITRTASEWRNILIGCKYSVSGYGTVFDQNEPGVIPRVLTEWVRVRKHHQKLMREAESQLKELKAKYQ